MYKPFLLPFIKVTIILSILVGFYFLTMYTFGYIFPFLLAIILALIMNPAVSLLEQLRIPRGFATLIVLIFSLLLLFGLIFLIVVEVIQGTNFLAENIPSYFKSFVRLTEAWITEEIIPLYQNILSYFQTLNPNQQTAIQDYIQQTLSNVATNGAEALQNFFMNIPSYIANVPEFFSILIVTILATFFISKDWKTLRSFVYNHIPKNILNYSEDFIRHLKSGVAGYLRAQLLLLSISTVIIFIGLLILNVQHALTITLLTALFDILPLIGTGLIFIPWIIYSFLAGNYTMTIGLTITYMVVVISRQILEPKVLSDGIGVNPLLGLVLLFVSFQIWGVIGILLAPILLIVIHVFVESGLLRQVWEYVKA